MLTPACSRYLRARRWVPEDAYTQFKDTEDWRAANNIDTLYRTIDVNAYDESRRLVSSKQQSSRMLRTRFEKTAS